MLRTKDIMSCLPLLACILGKQYNITVEIGGTTAYTNGKTIHIPSLKIDTDEMYINMTRGYVDHEAAHIRYTDFQLLQKANLTRLQFHLFNIIEDWRVEMQKKLRFHHCVSFWERKTKGRKQRSGLLCSGVHPFDRKELE